MPTRKWGSEKQANTTTLNNQETSDVAVLADGSFVVVWVDNDNNGNLPDQDIRGQRFDAVGAKIGAEFAISAPTAPLGDQTAPSVTALANGGFYVGWNDFDAFTDHDVVGAVFDASGAFVRSQDANSVSGDDVNNIGVARLGTGSITVWTNHSLNTGDFDVHFRIFDAAGNGGSELVANTTTTDAQGTPTVAVSPDQTTVAIAWRDTSDYSLKGRLFTATGAQFAPEFRVDVPAGALDVFTPIVTWLNNDDFVVVWRQANSFNAGDNELKARIFDGVSATVGALTGNIPVNSTIAGSQQNATLTALPNGGFVVAWEDVSGVGVDSNFSIRLQAFDGAGNKTGGEVVVNTTTTGSQFQPSIAALPDGRVVVTWTDASQSGGDTSGTAIRMQIIDPRDGIVSGTPANETLYGHDLVNDEISAGAGNDGLYGLRATTRCMAVTATIAS